jgi:hypothetical protein
VLFYGVTTMIAAGVVRFRATGRLYVFRDGRAALNLLYTCIHVRSTLSRLARAACRLPSSILRMFESFHCRGGSCSR